MPKPRGSPRKRAAKKVPEVAKKSAKKAPKAAKKAKAAAKAKYFIFVMEMGGHECFENAAEAHRFEADNEDIIAKKFEFTTKQSFKQQKSVCAKLMTTPKKAAKKSATPTKSETPTLSPEERGALDRIAKRLDLQKPCNRIHVYWRTTGRSIKCVLIVRFLNAQGQDQWFIKPKEFAIAIAAYVGEFKVETPLMQEALENFTYGRRRDPTGDKDKVEATDWTSADGKYSRTYDLFTAYTTFTIPHETLSSVEEKRNIFQMSSTHSR